jgi:hypothetical protein
MIQIEIPAHASYDSVSGQLETLEGVEKAFPNLIVKTHIDLVPAPAPGSEEWSKDSSYWVGRLNLQEAWNILDDFGLPIGSTPIGIVDLGYNWEFPHSRQFGIEVYDFSGNKISDEITKKSSDDSDGHGTFVTLFAAGDGHPDGQNKMDGVGVSWGSSVKIVDRDYVEYGNDPDNPTPEETYFHVSACINLILENFPECKVINVSCGADKDLEDEEYITQQQHFRLYMHWVLEKATKQSALIVFSAGNRKVDNDNSYYPPGDQTTTSYWETNAIVVGGSTWIDGEDDKRYDLGGHVGSTLGDVVDIIAPAQCVSPILDFRQNGTSFAAPMVTGAASLIWTIRSDLEPAEVKKILVETSRKLDWTDLGINKDYFLMDVGKALRQAADASQYSVRADIGTLKMVCQSRVSTYSSY